MIVQVAVGFGLTWIVTEDVDVQDPLVMVQLKTLSPMLNPLTDVVAFEGFEIVPLPLTNAHWPVPATAVFPVRVAVVIPQSVWFEPAFAVVGAASI